MRIVGVVATILGVILFVVGVRWLKSLKQLVPDDGDAQTGSFQSSIQLLFSTEIADDQFRRHQRHTVRAFCWSALLLFVGRMAVMLG